VIACRVCGHPSLYGFLVCSVECGHNIAKEAVSGQNKTALIDAKFQSSNSVPVERITVTRDEWFGEGE